MSESFLGARTSVSLHSSATQFSNSPRKSVAAYKYGDIRPITLSREELERGKGPAIKGHYDMRPQILRWLEEVQCEHSLFAHLMNGERKEEGSFSSK